MNAEPVMLRSAALEVTVDPFVGGAITAIRHLPSGLSVLGNVPWPTTREPLPGPLGARDEPQWLTRYAGGWPIMFPNGGSACTVDGMFHGFHGEASVVAWEHGFEGDTLVLEHSFRTVAAMMRRAIAVEDDVVVVRETLRTTGDAELRAMWGHHPTFGSDLLAAPFEIATNAQRVVADDGHDGPANPLRPGAAGRWPTLPGKSGPVDLARPAAPAAALAYLSDFDGPPWAAIRRLDGAIAAALSWNASAFPLAWLWLELEGNVDPPWDGRTRLIGIEPNATAPAYGIADTIRRGRPLLELRPGEERTADVRLHVFAPRGPIAGVGRDGRVFGSPDAVKRKRGDDRRQCLSASSSGERSETRGPRAKRRELRPGPSGQARG